MRKIIVTARRASSLVKRLPGMVPVSQCRLFRFSQESQQKISVPGEGHEQQSVFRRCAAQVRQAQQNLYARRMALRRLIGGQRKDLVFGETCVTDQRVSQSLRVVRRPVERRN